FSGVLGLCIPGVSRKISCASGEFFMPVILFLVVFGLSATIEILSPITALKNVDLPTLGRPMIPINPDLNKLLFSCIPIRFQRLSLLAQPAPAQAGVVGFLKRMFIYACPSLLPAASLSFKSKMVLKLANCRRELSVESRNFYGKRFHRISAHGNRAPFLPHR